MNKHSDMVRTVTFVEKFQDEMVTKKTFTKTAQHFFLVSSRRYQDFRNFLQNPKVPQNVIGSNNHN